MVDVKTPGRGDDRLGTTNLSLEEALNYIGNAMIRKHANIGAYIRTAVYSILTVLALVVTVYHLGAPSHKSDEASSIMVQVLSITKRATAATATDSLLRDFQVYPPVLTPSDDGVTVLTNGNGAGFTTSVNVAKKGCVKQVVLMDHVFAYSYGQPFIGIYKPPGCNFNRVTFNLTVTSAGRQFDRLGIVYMGDTEIWRTSTAEPTSTGIIWTYVKDMSNYLALFQQQQKLIFDLGNLIDATYTGTYNATLTATFFTGEDAVKPADRILPISARLAAQNGSSVFTVPSQNASDSISLPRRTRRAVVTIAATGQIGEEFWYTNVLNSDINTFGPGFLYGYSPFREVQLYIDGSLAGVVWPFPVVFTGGIVPGLWRPIVGIDAFDLKEDEIDITPWLPLICNGKSHTFEIKIAGINDDGKGNGQIANSGGEFWTSSQYWLVTGKIFLWLDPVGSVTTGGAITCKSPAPSITISSSTGVDVNGTNETLTYSVGVNRHFSTSSTITTANGTYTATWKQSLSYSNQGYYTDYGYSEIQIQATNGVDKSSSGYSRQISYPIYLNTSFAEVGNDLSIFAFVERGENIDIAGIPIFPSGLQSFDVLPAVQASYPSFQASSLQTTQNGTAYYFSNGSTSSSYGTTEQDMLFKGSQIGSTSSEYGYPPVTASRELYHRYVKAVNTTVVLDDETLVGQNTVSSTNLALDSDSTAFAPSTPQKALGHGHSD